MKRTITLILLFLAAFPLRAQFYSNDGDPGHLRWYTIETPHYQLIYPSGIDSLARVYGRLLEQFRVPAGRSFGQTPGDGQWGKLPVVLHPYNPYSNGAVGWAPKRMDLFTIPLSDASDPAPWPVQLIAHEPRHQAQFQRAGHSYFKVLGYLAGEAWNPVYWQLYLSWALGEGDATVTETGLAAGTRARTADFLNYYRIAFDQGDYRNWYRWRFGSYKHETPDHYALGYLSLAGARYLYDDPLITKEMMELSRRKPYLFSAENYRQVVRQHNGGKPFKEVFRDIQDAFNEIWRQDAAARAPFMPMEQLTQEESYPVNYSSQQVLPDGTLIAFRKGFMHANDLVEIRGGRVRHLKYVNGTGVSLVYEPGKNRVYWTETRLDARWKKAGSSQVVYYDLSTGRAQDLTRGNHLYFNVQPSDDGSLLAVAEYMPDGKQYVVLLSTENGKELRRMRVPDGIQPGEFGWCGDDLYLSGITLGGYGIYRITGAGGKWEQVLAPSIQKVVNMNSGDGYVEWTSDRTGVNEVYHYFPEDGRLLQMTRSRYGVKDPYLEGDYLYTSSPTLNGNMLYRTRVSDLRPREVKYDDVHAYPVEDVLTAQERSLGPAPDLQSAVPMSKPGRYYKWRHPMRLHSWLPFYVNYDNVMEGSFDLSYKTVSLGLSGFFQNTLGTVSGMVGYGLHPSPDNRANWRNAFHAKLVYTGLYPVFEASVDVGDKAARQYFVNRYLQGPFLMDQNVGGILSKAPLVEASFKAYLPLSWRRYGISYGLIPQLSYSFTNNKLAPDPVTWTLPRHPNGLRTHYRLGDMGSDQGNVSMQRLTASVRAYAILSMADNAVFPKWGIGAEIGGNMRPGLQQLFPPNVYAYLYGYLPGIWPAQGLRLAGMVQRQIRTDGLFFGELAANTLPRGFDREIGSVVAQAHPFQWKITADYAIPIYVGDISIPGLAYIKNFVLTPHGDFAGLSGGNLWSVGADLTAEMAKLILPFDSSLGVSFSWLGGSWYKNTNQERPWSVELIFGMDF